jgi:2'-5' RNA ligase
MSTVALVLHEPAASRVRELWALLEDRFGLAGVRAVPFPHVTLLGFEGLSHAEAKGVLERVSQATPPFSLEASGVGLFNDPAPILYAPVVPTPGLHGLQRAICEGLEALGAQTFRLYRPELWMPHITLAQGTPAQGTYGAAVDALMAENLHIVMEVRNLTLFQWIGPRYEPCDRFPLMGA